MPLVLVAIFILFALVDGLWGWYVFSALRKSASGSKAKRQARAAGLVLVMTLAILVVSVGVALFTRSTGRPNVLPRFLEAAVLLWHLAILPITIVLTGGIAAIAATCKGVGRAFSRASKSDASPPPANAPEGLSRRGLLLATAAIAPPAVLALGTGMSLARLDDFHVHEADVPIPNLPPDLDGLTIAHLADTHLGDFTPPPLYRRMIDATNALRADLIVHTGDVINVDSSDLPEAMAGLRRLDAPLGVFVCEGNHDLIQSPGRFWKAIRDVPNIRFLRNDAATISARGHPVQLLGVRWGTKADAGPNSKASRRSDMEIEAACADVAPSLEPGAFPIALAHHPHAFDYAPWARLVLSGHTHGGQVMLTRNLGPGPLMYRYWAGLYREPNRTLVVSNGAGNWFPLRVNARAEIVKLTLRRV